MKQLFCAVLLGALLTTFGCSNTVVQPTVVTEQDRELFNQEQQRVAELEKQRPRR